MDLLRLLMEVLPTVLPLILECLNNEGEDRTFANLREPGPFVFLRARRGFIRDGMDRRAANAKAFECCEALRQASDMQIRELLANAKEAA